jgi:hypothetical protein
MLNEATPHLVDTHQLWSGFLATRADDHQHRALVSGLAEAADETPRTQKLMCLNRVTRTITNTPLSI